MLRFVTSGGGGYGDPFEREPERVLDDVADGFVTADAACTDYGVILDTTGLAVDPVATARARSAHRAPSALFDRGAQFEELERSRQRAANSDSALR